MHLRRNWLTGKRLNTSPCTINSIPYQRHCNRKYRNSLLYAGMEDLVVLNRKHLIILAHSTCTHNCWNTKKVVIK